MSEFRFNDVCLRNDFIQQFIFIYSSLHDNNISMIPDGSFSDLHAITHL